MFFRACTGLAPCLIAFLALFAPQAHAACPGAPSGADCCSRYGRDAYCRPGTVCRKQGGCCPEGTIHTSTGCLDRDSPRVCAGGNQFCEPGYFCTKDKKCTKRSPAQQEQDRREYEEAEREHDAFERQLKANADKLRRYNEDVRQGKVQCSTITDKDHPSSGQCEQATRSLKSARTQNVRRNYPLVAQDEYRRAAKASQEAGDRAGAAAILQELEAFLKEAASPSPAIAKPDAATERNRNTCDNFLKLARSGAQTWRTEMRPRWWTGRAAVYGHDNWSQADTNYDSAIDACKAAKETAKMDEAIREREALKREYREFVNKNPEPPPPTAGCKELIDMRDKLQKDGLEPNPLIETEIAKNNCG